MLAKKADMLCLMLTQDGGVLALCIFGWPYILGGCLCLGLISLYTDAVRCPLCLRLSSFSVNFRLKRSVGSLLRSWYAPLAIRVLILPC